MVQFLQMDNLKIAVVSDSHDNKVNLEKIVSIANERKCDYLLHLGDIVAPITAQVLAGFNGMVNAVFGNCDGDVLNLKRVFNSFGGDIEKAPVSLVLADKNIVMLHEPHLLDFLIKAQETDFIFYGHLHTVDVRKSGRTFVMNPGDAGGLVRKASFFILNLPAEEYERVDL